MLFLFSVLMVIASLGSAGWLAATGQAGSVDGLFLLLTCLLVAFSFGLYIAYVIHREMEAQKTPAPQVTRSTAAAGPKVAAEKPKAATSSQPVQTS